MNDTIAAARTRRIDRPRTRAHQRQVLPNGVRLAFESWTDFGEVAVVLLIRAGSADDPPGREGLARLVQRVAFAGPRNGGFFEAHIRGLGTSRWWVHKLGRDDVLSTPHRCSKRFRRSVNRPCRSSPFPCRRDQPSQKSPWSSIEK